MYQDYKDLLSAFNAHGVKYPIVGGYAVIFHIAIPNPYVHHFKEFLMGTAGLGIVGLSIAALLRFPF